MGIPVCLPDKRDHPLPTEKQKSRHIARDAGLVMILILLSRLLGFIRERGIADVFGLNIETDLFRLAFNIPDLMYFLLIAGGLNAAFIPVFTSYLAKDEEDEAWRLATTFFTLVGLALLAMVALGIIFTPQLTPLVAYGYVGETRALLVQLMRLMFPAVFFTALAGAAMGVHKSYKHFAPPMWGPIAYNFMIILSTYVLGRQYGIVAMAYGTVAGAIVNFIIQLPFVWRKFKGRLFRFDLSHPGLKRALQLMGPAVISLSIFQINFILLSNLASGLQEGSPTALRIGQTIVQLPLGVFAMGMGMVILPSLSTLVAQEKMDELRSTFSEGLRAVLFVTIPSAIGLFVLRVPVVRLLFETGEFTADDTQIAAFVLGFLAIGLSAQAGSQILTQMFYSLHETRALMKISTIAIVANTTLAFAFLKLTNLGVGGLALAYALTAIVNFFNYLFALKKRIGSIDGRRIAWTVLRSGAASGIMAAAVYVVRVPVDHLVTGSGFLGQTLHLAIVIAAGVIVYGGLALLLKMEEMNFVKVMFSPMGRRFRR